MVLPLASQQFSTPAAPFSFWACSLHCSRLLVSLPHFSNNVCSSAAALLLCAVWPGSGGLRDTDLLLYVSSEAGSCMPGMIAMATACDVDPVSGRPILGSLNVCGGALAGLAGLAAGSEAEAAAVGRLVEVLVHEVVHVLVSRLRSATVQHAGSSSWLAHTSACDGDSQRGV
jgi:hypothetical protein